MNILALTPLLERFESEHGTLTSLALFFGREYTLDWWMEGESADAAVE